VKLKDFYNLFLGSSRFKKPW